MRIHSGASFLCDRKFHFLSHKKDGRTDISAVCRKTAALKSTGFQQIVEDSFPPSDR